MERFCNGIPEHFTHLLSNPPNEGLLASTYSVILTHSVGIQWKVRPLQEALVKGFDFICNMHQKIDFHFWGENDVWKSWVFQGSILWRNKPLCAGERAPLPPYSLHIRPLLVYTQHDFNSIWWMKLLCCLCSHPGTFNFKRGKQALCLHWVWGMIPKRVLTTG